MKNFLFAFSLLVFSNPTGAEMVIGDKQVVQVKTLLLTDLPFKGAEAGGGSNCPMYFLDVVILNRIRDVVTAIDNVDVRLDPGAKKYTTLDILNLGEGMATLRTAQKVTIVVRDKNDFKIWNAFLKKNIKKRDEWRKIWLEPTRILPPKD